MLIMMFKLSHEINDIFTFVLHLLKFTFLIFVARTFLCVCACSSFGCCAVVDFSFFNILRVYFSTSSSSYFVSLFFVSLHNCVWNFYRLFGNATIHIASMHHYDDFVVWLLDISILFGEHSRLIVNGKTKNH